MLPNWINFARAPSEPPPQVQELIAAVQEMGAELRATQGADGGLKRSMFRPLLKDLMNGSEPPLAGFGATELDFVVPTARVALSVQAGRAKDNNGALLAVLAAAAQPSVDWLVLAAPEQYKRSTPRISVHRQLDEFALAAGIHLQLYGVSLTGY